MNLKNPNKHGCVLVETIGKNDEGLHESRCYPGPTPNGRSKPFKVDQFPIFKSGFNPKKFSLHGEKIIIYAKNMTLEFDKDGNVTTHPINTWED